MLATAPSRVECLDAGLLRHLLAPRVPRAGHRRCSPISPGARGPRRCASRSTIAPTAASATATSCSRRATRTSCAPCSAQVTARGASWACTATVRSTRSTSDDVAVMKGISGVVATALRSHVRAATPWLGQPSAPGLVVIDREGRGCLGQRRRHGLVARALAARRDHDRRSTPASIARHLHPAGPRPGGPDSPLRAGRNGRRQSLKVGSGFPLGCGYATAGGDGWCCTPRR